MVLGMEYFYPARIQHEMKELIYCNNRGKVMIINYLVHLVERRSGLGRVIFSQIQESSTYWTSFANL